MSTCVPWQAGMTEDSDITLAITAALLLLALLGGVFVDPVLFVFAGVIVVMLALVVREIRCR